MLNGGNWKLGKSLLSNTFFFKSIITKIWLGLQKPLVISIIFYYFHKFFILGKFHFYRKVSKYREFPYFPQSITLTVNILYYYGTFFLTKESRCGCNYYPSSTLYLEFTSFPLMCFVHSRTPFRILHYI